jgi:hypothetical protein
VAIESAPEVQHSSKSMRNKFMRRPHVTPLGTIFSPLHLETLQEAEERNLHLRFEGFSWIQVTAKTLDENFKDAKTALEYELIAHKSSLEMVGLTTLKNQFLMGVIAVANNKPLDSRILAGNGSLLRI